VDKMELVLKAVTPIYSILRYADQQNNGIILGFLPMMVRAQNKIYGKLKHNDHTTSSLMGRFIYVINRRTRYLLNNTLMLAGKKIVLNLCSLPCILVFLYPDFISS
jgi:hypothetical protein